LRRYLWLAIDRAYKSAVESIARKRAALKNISIGEQPDDFTKAAPVKLVTRCGQLPSMRRCGKRAREALGSLCKIP